MLEYQMIGSLLRRSSQSTKSYDASSQGTNPNIDDASADYEINQNKVGDQGNEVINVVADNVIDVVMDNWTLRKF